jgi:hypothetical protein
MQLGPDGPEVPEGPDGEDGPEAPPEGPLGPLVPLQAMSPSWQVGGIEGTGLVSQFNPIPGWQSVDIQQG